MRSRLCDASSHGPETHDPSRSSFRFAFKTQNFYPVCTIRAYPKECSRSGTCKKCPTSIKEFIRENFKVFTWVNMEDSCFTSLCSTKSKLENVGSCIVPFHSFSLHRFRSLFNLSLTEQCVRIHMNIRTFVIDTLTQMWGLLAFWFGPGSKNQTPKIRTC